MHTVTKAKQTNAKDRTKSRNLLPLVALGSGLAAMPAAALELGDVTVESSLGQPLRASIAYALGPNEMLSSTCVSVSGARSTGGLPGIGASTVRVTDGAILITAGAAVYEPMLGARVTINCPYTPNLSREYLLFVDPAPVAEALRSMPPVARSETSPARAPVAATRPATRAPASDRPIGQSSNYQVRPGDTLSGIVRRIENRTMKLWPAVNAIFAANPEAFIDNDPNQLKAGAWLTIPSLDGTAPVVSAAAAPAATPAPTAEAAPLGNDQAELGAATVGDTTADLKPGDVAFDYATADARATIVIPDAVSAEPQANVTVSEEPQAAVTTPAVPTTIVSTGARRESTSLLVWLLGGALVIIGSLAVFGRRFRKGSAPAPLAAAAAGSAATESDTVETCSDYDIEDDSPTEENLALDADLELGTGFDEDIEMDVAAVDFGFAATTNLDIELPFEPQAPVDAGTDIIPPVHMNVESILESEVLPEDDDYDMSVIVDATKMPQPEEVTERDLMAVEVGSGDETANSSYTISRDVDYDILEQDYEDELTATQALNQEIERAAAELAKDTGEAPDDHATAALPVSSYDPDDTNAVTMNMSRDDETAEMSVANDDETTEMEIEGATVDTKRLG